MLLSLLILIILSLGDFFVLLALPWRLLFHTVVRMPVPPLSLLGLGTGSGSGLGSAPAASAPAPPPLPPSSVTDPASPPTSPQRSRQAAHQLERDRCVVGSPENCRTPATPPLHSMQLSTLNGHTYSYLPADLAAQVAALSAPTPLRHSRSASAVSFTFAFKVFMLIIHLSCPRHHPCSGSLHMLGPLLLPMPLSLFLL